MANRVDAAVEAVKTAALHSVPYGARRQPGQLQLTKRDHPVLAHRELADADNARGSLQMRPT